VRVSPAHPVSSLAILGNEIRSSLPYCDWSGVVGISAVAALREYTSTPATTEIDLADGSATIRGVVTTSDTGHLVSSKFTHSASFLLSKSEAFIPTFQLGVPMLPKSSLAFVVG
jgi:hypothetical protein